tara:strand:+ start:97 stop:501 length:405 start_codon:yes stop_codon:yes gene_type:complete
MIKKKNFLSVVFRNVSPFLLFIIFSFSIDIDHVFAMTNDWVDGSKSKFGEQLLDKKSIKRNKDGSIRVLSKFIPKTKGEIIEDILYTMDINCFEKSFRDINISPGPENNVMDWRDPKGDELIIGVINQVCNLEN